MIVIPVYNTNDLEPIVLRCLYSIQNTTDRPMCIVDDGSPKKLLFDVSGEDVLIRSGENEGYTAAVNTGLKYAMTKKNHNVFIVANSDLYIRSPLEWDWVSDCKEHTIVSPKTSDEGEGGFFGSLWAVHRTVIEKIGYLNEQMRHFFSDTEYFYRAQRNGVSIIKRNDIVIEHIGHASYKTLKNKDQLYEDDQKVYRNLV